MEAELIAPSFNLEIDVRGEESHHVYEAEPEEGELSADKIKESTKVDALNVGDGESCTARGAVFNDGDPLSIEWQKERVFWETMVRNAHQEAAANNAAEQGQRRHNAYMTIELHASTFFYVAQGI